MTIAGFPNKATTKPFNDQASKVFGGKSFFFPDRVTKVEGFPGWCSSQRKLKYGDLNINGLLP